GDEAEVEALDAVALERVRLEVAQERLVGEVVPEHPVLLRRERPRRAPDPLRALLLPLVYEELGRADGQQQFLEPRLRHLGHLELARRRVHEREADPTLVLLLRAPGGSGEVVALLRREESVAE